MHLVPHAVTPSQHLSVAEHQGPAKPMFMSNRESLSLRQVIDSLSCIQKSFIRILNCSLHSLKLFSFHYKHAKATRSEAAVYSRWLI